VRTSAPRHAARHVQNCAPTGGHAQGLATRLPSRGSISGVAVRRCVGLLLVAALALVLVVAVREPLLPCAPGGSDDDVQDQSQRESSPRPHRGVTESADHPAGTRALRSQDPSVSVPARISVVSRSPLPRRRYPEEVAGSAVLVGLIAAIPVAMVSLVAPLFAQTLADGGGVRRALGSAWITDSEDWEMIPLYLLGALVMSALTAVVASLVWSFVSARTPTRPSIAHVVAACAAAAVPLVVMLLVNPHWNLAVLPAAAAGLIALVAIPHLGYERSRRRRTTDSVG
jgi:hypothetical protein